LRRAHHARRAAGGDPGRRSRRPRARRPLPARPAAPHRPGGQRPLPRLRHRARGARLGGGRRRDAPAGGMGVAGPSRAPRAAPLLLVPGGLARLAGLDAALSLAGVPAPAGSPRLALLPGPLMVLGFLGTVIALERAVALRVVSGLLA